MAVQCPVAPPGFDLIKHNHGALASTGCTRDFCQSGRVIHTDEPRVGENRAISVVESEAEDFLREFYREGNFANEEAFQERLKRAQYQIRASAVQGVIRETNERGLVGGVWNQTPQELEFGLRRAWRNSRKCIMRSHSDDLRLCDLRDIKTSSKMAVALVKAVTDAFNGGNILPTVFVFPPRSANNRGPMIWNDQILTFAGYELEDGSILGDPKNVQLTNHIIQLGWKAPQVKTRWDVLPLVTMAEGDLPVITELPAHLRKLVEIRHPKYMKAFEELDLKWVPFPALSRLGFDIGGVQYTATPFIGWFMDAEIGVRNLADSFRYNVLPDVVKALRLDDGALVDVDSFDELPEYEQLAMLTRAQIELNYAVQNSFIRNKVSMSDSFTASMKWTKYDDEFYKKNGFRLPSDPYWIAPPQGSIVPLWHRGGAPNYQPKPMICRHVQDPAKAWKREEQNWPLASAKILASASSPDNSPQRDRTRSREATLSFHMDVGDSLPKKLNFTTSKSSTLFVPEEHHDEEARYVASTTPAVDTVTLKPLMNEGLNYPETDSISASPTPSVSISGSRSRGTSISSQTSVDENQALEKLEAPLPLSGKRHVRPGKDTVAIYYCGDAVSEDLGKRLYANIHASSPVLKKASLSVGIRPLNELEAPELTADRVFLLIVSTTNAGEIPANGSRFAEMCKELCETGNLKDVGSFRFAVFSDGDIRCTPSFDAAGQAVHDRLIEIGGITLTDGPFKSNRAVSNPPLSALDRWWSQVQQKMDVTPITIYYCGEEPVSEKLAKKLHENISESGVISQNLHLSADVRPLDDLDPSSLTANKVFLFVVSTTGTGGVPSNGKGFAGVCDELVKGEEKASAGTFKFAVFGDGDSRCATPFNAAAITIHESLVKLGGISLVDGPFESNRAVSFPPLRALDAWWGKLKIKVRDLDPNGAATEDEEPKGDNEPYGNSRIRAQVAVKGYVPAFGTVLKDALNSWWNFL